MVFLSSLWRIIFYALCSAWNIVMLRRASESPSRMVNLDQDPRGFRQGPTGDLFLKKFFGSARVLKFIFFYSFFSLHFISNKNETKRVNSNKNALLEKLKKGAEKGRFLGGFGRGKNRGFFRKIRSQVVPCKKYTFKIFKKNFYFCLNSGVPRGVCTPLKNRGEKGDFLIVLI